MNTPAQPESPSPLLARLLPLAALLIGNAALAMGPWFVRMADTGPVATGFWRIGLALPVLALLALANGQQLHGLPRRTVLAVMAGGVFFGLDIASWHIGIGMTRLANATLFGNAGSLVLMVWGFIAWRRLPRGQEWPALAAALIGAAVLMGRSFEISPRTLMGDLFCLTAGMLYAGYLLILQDARKGLGSWSLLTWSCLGSVPVLLIIALLRNEAIMPTSWTPVIGLAISSQLIGQGMLVYALRHFSPLVIGIALLCQPAVAAMAGWISFGEVLTGVDLLGIALVGSALVLAKVTPRGARGARAKAD
ncbi:EamA family transporter [Altererythrobacter xixiisoli]|uniref:EamA family transporter n=1 Tax=Croceibacterium xixiisoli TaxID=1476466 RepID=A0A6I4TQA3_9SPHN|nr:DMT family transporter [Croceibacterium xixiisoli]MXO98036.1 EamA family transporter [Croceibacterium xixiisoli]